MATLDMSDALEFNEDNISLIKSRVGNYALGNFRRKPDASKRTFFVKYVGRSDNDLHGRLVNHLNNDDIPFSHFKYSYSYSILAAYKKECINYHEFRKGLINDIHPRKPNGMGKMKCPVCDV
jgi:hypothetical protein